MAKNQSRKPGRDVRGGKGANQRKADARGVRKGQGKGGSAPYGRGQGGDHGLARRGGAAAKKGARGPATADRRQGAPHGKAAHAGRRPGGPGASWIEGRRAVAEALEAGIPLRRALVAEGDGSDAALSALVSQLELADVRVEATDRARLDSISSHGAHQGIVAQAEPYRYAELADIIEAAGEGDALVLVLDHVTDQGNLGAIVRSAEVVGAAGVVIAKARAAGVGVGAFKTSAGAVMHVPIAQVSNLATALEQLKEAGFWVGGATEHARDDVWGAPIDGRFCLVMGSEGSGISRLVRERCDFECRLPQRGRVESLNVAQAATVMCYEWLRRVSTGAYVGAEAGVVSPSEDGLATAADEDLGDAVPAVTRPLGRQGGNPGDGMSFDVDAAAGLELDWDL